VGPSFTFWIVQLIRAFEFYIREQGSIFINTPAFLKYICSDSIGNKQALGTQSNFRLESKFLLPIKSELFIIMFQIL